MSLATSTINSLLTRISMLAATSAIVIGLGADFAQAKLVQRSYTAENGKDFTGTDSNGAFIWGMNVNPINNVGQVDVDSNGTKDFHESGATNVNPSDGLASNTDGGLFRWDYGGSPSRAAGLETGNPSYTVELDLDIKSTGTEGSRGVFGIALDFTGSTNRGRVQLEIGRDDLHFQGGVAANTVLTDDAATQSNLGSHTWRISYEATSATAGQFWFYRDSQLLNRDGVPIPGTIDVGTPSITLIGDYSGGLSGDWELDYIALDSTGAFAPQTVPEPSTLFLTVLTIVSLACTRRRRNSRRS